MSNIDKKQRLLELEAILANNAKPVAESQSALNEIEEKELWRESGCKSFEQYYVKNAARFGFSTGEKRNYQRFVFHQFNKEFKESTGVPLPNESTGRVMKAHAKKIQDPIKKGKAFIDYIAKHPDGGDSKKVKDFFSENASEFGVVNEGNEFPVPDRIFNPLNRLFHYDLDVAASDINTKVTGKGNYFTIHDDGLVQDWSVNGKKTIWCNPPYGKGLVKWLWKAYETAHYGPLVCVLTFNTTETQWFQYCAKVADILFFPGRADLVGETGKHRFGYMLMLFHLRPLTPAQHAGLMDLGVFFPAQIPLVEVGWHHFDEMEMTEAEWIQKWGWKSRSGAVEELIPAWAA